MQEMSNKFNNPQIVENIAKFTGVEVDEFSQHHVTENEYLECLNYEELQEAIHNMVYSMIRRKSFDTAKLLKEWIIMLDGTQLYYGNRQINDKCLERHHNKGTENEIVNYHINVLEAKIYFGSRFVSSICSEFIENNGEEDTQRQKNMSEDEFK